MITCALDTHIGQIRLEIGDTQENAGPFPDGRNFMDAELHYLYESEGENVGRAAARAAEVLATSWAGAPTDVTLGPHRTRYAAHGYWVKEAARLRNQFGNAQAPESFNARLKISRITDPTE